MSLILTNFIKNIEKEKKLPIHVKLREFVLKDVLMDLDATR